jgi:ATP-dependent DNA ligase
MKKMALDIDKRLVEIPYWATTSDTKALGQKNFQERYIMQEKIDGERLIVSVGKDGVIGHNKYGEEIPFPDAIKNALLYIDRGNEWVFDGELFQGKFCIFNLIEAPGHILEGDVKLKLDSLEIIVDAINDPVIEYVRYYADEPMESVFAKLIIDKAEGVVFRYIEDHFSLSRYKFRNEIDCVYITEPPDEDEILFGVYNKDKDLIEVTHLPTSVFSERELGELRMGREATVTISCLKISRNNKLVRPQLKEVRHDKKQEDCNTKQFNNLRRIIK